MICFWQQSTSIRDSIYIPKYYDPTLSADLFKLRKTHYCVSVGRLAQLAAITVATGDEIGKAAYGTGDIPFVRTSDISNWEIKGAAKQGVSQEIYDEYAKDQDVRIGDILFVRDGTYLIGNNCFITAIDKEILYQSHVLKIRVNDTSRLDPHLLFLAFNNPYVQRQIRSFQFTADIIDTIGNRFFEIILPLPRDQAVAINLANRCSLALKDRMIGKAFVKHCPTLMEEALRTGSSGPLRTFLKMPVDKMVSVVRNETVSSEFGPFTAYWKSADEILNQVYLPKYYDITIQEELRNLSAHCHIHTIGRLAIDNILEYHTGDEVGKMAYGTGEIPFLRTSDFGNWEINYNPKQRVSQDVYDEYAKAQDVRENDVLLVRDGTYLVGSSCMITSKDAVSLYCGGLIKFRMLSDLLDPFLFLGLLNSYIVKRQIRSKQFTRDVIDTLGNRVDEVVLPIPKSKALRNAISESVRLVIEKRISARDEIVNLSQGLA
jgi:hypothetical protein